MQQIQQTNPRARNSATWRLPVAAALLFVISTWPALYGYRVIRGYASLPTVPVSRQRDVAIRTPNVMPILDGRGIAVTANGDIYAIDMVTGRLISFENGTSPTERVIVPRRGTERLHEPQSLCVGPDGLIHVLEKLTGTVSTFDRSGRTISAHQMVSPGDGVLTVDADGNLFVCDNRDGLIRKFRPGGHPDFAWGDDKTPGAAPVADVMGLTASRGELYATVAGQNVIVRLDADGREIGRTRALGNVGTLAADPDGQLYMGDSLTGRVWTIDREGRTRARLVGADGDQEIFENPSALAVSGDGNLYVMAGMSIAVYSFTSGEESR